MTSRRSTLSGEAYVPPTLAGSVSRRASMSDLDTPSGGAARRHIYTSQGVMEYESVPQEEEDELEEEENVGLAEVNSQAPLVVGGGTLHHIYFRSGEIIPFMSEDASPTIPPEEMAEELAALRALPPVSAVPAGSVGGHARRNSSNSFSAPPPRRRVPRRASFAHIGQRLMPTILEEGAFSVPRPIVSPPRRRRSTLAPIGTPRASSSPNPPPHPLPPSLQPPRARTMSAPGSGSAQLLPDSEAIHDDGFALPPGHPHVNENPTMAQSSRVIAPPVSASVERQGQLQSLPPPQQGQQQGTPQSLPLLQQAYQHGQRVNGSGNTDNGVPNSQSFPPAGPPIVSSTANGLPPGTLNGPPRSNSSGSRSTHTPITAPPRAYTLTPTQIMTESITPNPYGGSLTTPPNPNPFTNPPANSERNTPSPITVPPRARTVAPTRGFDPDGPLPPGMIGNPAVLYPHFPCYSQHEEVSRAYQRLERDARNKQEGRLVDVKDPELW
ncbi:hypothetical protein HDK90DRAFT_463283 [Phyllosticta capitalensis]|uniref:Uncharacterized protein n=1 Tax=Phyllosticta capitalensis TaxID=121624 RepID=A0ABR1Z0G8_9PEZI